MIEWQPGVYRWRQIADDLTRRIDAGDIPPGGLLSENGLMQEYGVARATVRRALSELRNRKLIFTRQYLGSFVGQDPEGDNA
ncbi:winged helix-turn-helix domain-containing protein [Streptosporangium sp. NPDC049078]|uniref:winged helix-turn-helix domain-containing protein n=1 Tax=Streptosporangium sp. NPDC049078 TaxID=3155767 RepID=UPI0034294D15